MDWSVLYDPHYSVIGVDATIATAGGGSAAVTAIDHTAGIEASVGGVETVRPAARVRVAELDDAGLARADLEGGATIALNGSTWTIVATQPRPTPGEAPGELLLILEAT